MPLEVFYSYSHKDEDLRNELETHLSLLERSGLIVAWHDRRIGAGEEWSKEIDAHIQSAQVILLLISPDFLASEYCYGIEMKTALERHAREHAIVIPIILRPADWSGAPFAHLQALPRDAKAVTLWPNRDQAFAEIAGSLREIAVRFQRPVPEPPAATQLEDQAIPKPRVLDAAMPGHIVKDRGTELLVLIRLPDSAGLAGVLQADDEAEARPEDVRSRPFDITFPLGPTGRPESLKVTIELTSPDFSPPQQRKNLFVPVNADSEICPFLLTPVRIGQLTVVIELQWQDAQRGYRRLRTNCVAEAGEAVVKPAMHVVQMPLVVGSMNDRRPAMVAAPAAALPPISLPPPPPSSKRTSLASPALKAVAAAVCLIGIGGVFLTQRNASAPPPVTSAIAVPPGVRVLTTVSSEAVACQEKATPFEILIPDVHRLAMSHAGVVPGIELQPVARMGDVNPRNVQLDVKKGKLSGEIYAKGGCASPQSAVASYKVVAFYNSP
jgi:TIR domain-containing protein